MLILASNSPRRKELLSALGYAFSVVPSRFSEAEMRASARETALAFACGKARDVFSRRREDVVLGADTVVALKDKILGKPQDAEHAKEMLRLLSGEIHSVFTGVCLAFRGGEQAFVAETKVEFFPLSEELIGEYVRSGLPFDKAGAYGIQDGYPLVKRIEGSYHNVVGLPTEELDVRLRALGVCKC